MPDAVQMFILAFALGLTGALAPGPTLVATINSSLSGGWSMGPKVTLGHMVSELLIVLVVVAGLATVAMNYTTLVAGIGGAALVIFGLLTIAGSRTASLTGAGNGTPGVTANPYLAGFFTSVANPYFWIWWLTVGSAMLVSGLASGIILACVFMAGHWCADLAWFTAVSTGISRGTTIISDRVYRAVMVVCGVFLVLFGIYYLVQGAIIPAIGVE
jgi:threonine/homoserine/homoserine lactone efflux protein